MKTEKQPPLVPPEPPTNIEEAIRERAYELYELRGKSDGHDVDDWLEAEQEMSTPRAKMMAA